MSPRPVAPPVENEGRGRRLLTLRHVTARHAALGKLDARVVPPDVVAWVPGRVRSDRDIDLRVPVDLPGRHLQRAAAENA